ncbi:cytochrome oxidase putative small subunit CydP [Xanthomonas sp. WHRI 1810A]|uniref:cytochrome oxidase putative small subunit CydP n=1 Tax=Xanthomonas sp. WHRI 1810A TaxID=3161565 RepID=UPI0032E8D0A9
MPAHFDFLKKPLAREIAVILLIKLVLLMGIRSVWFDAPVAVKDDGAQVGQHLLGTPPVPSEKVPK